MGVCSVCHTRFSSTAHGEEPFPCCTVGSLPRETVLRDLLQRGSTLTSSGPAKPAAAGVPPTGTQSSQNCCGVGHSSTGCTPPRPGCSSLAAGHPLSIGSPTGAQPPPCIHLLWHGHLPRGLRMYVCIPRGSPGAAGGSLHPPWIPRGCGWISASPVDPQGLWVDLCIPRGSPGAAGAQLLHHGLHQSLQRNLGSGA